eukprot:TRINITY_DN750_c0_g1_i2.p1 TRINITY_DN750_c0_g1~~TRINITY_DN750_c0_g1_i2.p1  ORF type:complete len:227 (+),score=33.78 TRINITY_DN750_c0_g1_i2:74-754(+)
MVDLENQTPKSKPFADEAIDLVLNEFKEAALAPPDNKMGFVFNPITVLKKMTGKAWLGPPRWMHPFQQIWGAFGVFCTMIILAVLEQYCFRQETLGFMLACYSATCMLVLTFPSSPFSQPRNVLGGHIVSAYVGVTVYKLFGHEPEMYWFYCALAVAIAVLLMSLTKTSHPPAAAIALIAVSGSKTILDMGFLYIPLALLGAVIIVLMGLITNNLSKMQIYPVFWW